MTYVDVHGHLSPPGEKGGGPPALAVAWSAAGLIYFWSSFVTLGQLRFGDVVHWFYDHTLMPAMILRGIRILRC